MHTLEQVMHKSCCPVHAVQQLWSLPTTTLLPYIPENNRCHAPPTLNSGRYCTYSCQNNGRYYSYSWYNNVYQPAFLGGRSPLRRGLQGVGCCSYYTARENRYIFRQDGIEGARTLEKTITSRARTARDSILLQTPHTIIHYGTIDVTTVTIGTIYVTIVTMIR